MRAIRLFALTIAALVFALFTLIAGCGDDDGGANQSPGQTATLAGSPTPSPDPVVPPLEGPRREGYIGERQDFRLNPEYQLPKPGGVPTPSSDIDGFLIPPSDSECPDDWEKLRRPVEGFVLCYPADWAVLTDNYKNSPNEERWYTGGVFKFASEEREHQLAHVSIYVIPQYTRPFPYTKDCPTPLSVVLDGEPSVLCPSFPAPHPEARIVSYHVFRENLDYFFNVALYYRWDEEKAEYTEETDEQAFETALKIIHSVDFLEVPATQTTPPTAGQ